MNTNQLIKFFLRLIFSANKANFFEQPVFIVACGRSGSTALCNALDDHPQILMSHREALLVHYIGIMAYNYACGDDILHHQNSIAWNQEYFKRTLKLNCYTASFGLDYGFSYRLLNRRKKNSVFSGGNSIKFWGAKAFPNEPAAAGLLWLYPKAKFIYLHRNGLNVVQSMSKFGGFVKLDFADRCRFWRSGVESYEFLKNHKRSITVRFEDFLEKPSKVFKKIYSHLDLQSHYGPAEYASTTLVHPLDKPTQKANPQEILEKRPEPYATWTDEEKEIFKEICAESMKSLKYNISF